MDSLSVCCGIATTGGLREVQIVRFRQNHRRFYTGKQQHLVRIGYGYGPGRRGMVMVAASSKSAEAEGVSLRRAVKEELVDGESQQQKAQGRGLVHAVHESARVFLAGLREQKTLASRPWFPLKWPAADKNAWMQALAYQAAVHSLIQAVIDIAARGEGRNRSVRVFLQRRLMDLASPLEDSIRHELSSRDPAADDWLWLQQHPLALAKFVKLLEGDNRFINITSTDGAVNLAGSDVELLKMALSSTASLVMLGAAPVSNPIFSSKLVQAIYYLMDKMSECIPMNRVHRFCTDVGLKREFLGKFGSRAADDKKWRDSAEGEFWVYLVHQLLRGALVREGVRLRLKSRDTVEVLEKDLAVFGFFAVLGRSTRTYLASKGVSDSEESLASLLRYLEGGSVLFYPQLATIPIYQLFIEVVCEEMEWLPYYPVSTTAVVSHDSHGDNGQVKSGVGKVEKLLAIAVAVQVCSLWVKSFVEHNVWIRQPEGIRAATFLSKSQQRLEECNEVYELVKRNGKDDSFWRGASEGEYMDRLIYQDLQERCAEEASTSGVDRSGSDMEPLGTNEQLVKERRKLQEVEQLLKSVEKELQSVDIALAKLELLVKESEDAGLAGSERLRADLDKIRSLKQDVEVLKASLKSKASAREVRILELQADPQSINVRDRNLGATADDWNFQFQRRRRSNLSDSADEKTSEASKSVKTFEQLMVELSELESRIQQSADQSASVRSLSQEEWERASVYEVATTTALARIDENLDLTVVNRNFLTKSIEQLKEASVDIWRGSCLLGTDVGASLVLLRRKVLGQKLTSREKKILKRTATDIASVVPIGILMLLPVTAVGHAAILAAIQKYVPALIPSAYGPQRLDVLRRLEQLREMEPETPEAAALPPSSRDIDSSMQKETV